MVAVRAALYRGGTSKGLFLRAADLPSHLRALVPTVSDARQGRESPLDKFIAAAMGSDKYGMQLDGVGGGLSSTSKVAIVEESVHAGHDVDYTFGQVDMKVGTIDWSGSCGNLASAVALFALDEGLVKGGGKDASRVKVFQTNLQYSINVSVPALDTPAEHHIPGVEAPGRPIAVDFVRPRVGSLPLLPTGKVCDTLLLPTSETFEASIVCAANPTIFVRASDLGLESSPFPPPGSAQRLAPLIEAIRFQGSRMMGLPLTDAIRVSWLSAPTALKATDGAEMRPRDMAKILKSTLYTAGTWKIHSGTHFFENFCQDLAACITTPGRLHHHAFTVLLTPDNGGRGERGLEAGCRLLFAADDQGRGQSLFETES